MKFRKKPVTIDAIQFLGIKNLPKVLDFILDGHADYSHLPINLAFAKRGVAFKTATSQLEIPTLEWVMLADPLDMIVKGVKGEFYPVKPDIFVATYEDVDEPETTFKVLDEGEIEAAIAKSGWVLNGKDSAREFRGLATALAQALAQKNIGEIPFLYPVEASA